MKGILDAWRNEEEKGMNTEKEASMGETEAMSVLEIKERPDNDETGNKWDDLVRTKIEKLKM